MQYCMRFEVVLSAGRIVVDSSQDVGRIHQQYGADENAMVAVIHW